jgi:CDGSH-type Zn-finger protein
VENPKASLFVMAHMQARRLIPGSSFDEDGEAYLCACKHTGNTPFCDGTHKQFSDSDVGKEGPCIKTQAADTPVAVATPEEPTVEFIHQLARDGLSKLGHHGP